MANAVQILIPIVGKIPPKYLEPGREVAGLVSYQALVAVHARLTLALQQLRAAERGRI